jgi:hypothetical protein
MSNANSTFFKTLIFPHASTRKQKKEISSIYCYNICLVKSDNNDPDYINYINSLKKFINENKHLLVQWNDLSGNDKLYKRYLTTENTDKSLYWDFKYVEPAMKYELDNFLKFTGYKKKIDKYGFIYEGCLNDDKLFIGSKSDLIRDYCRLFPGTHYCKQFRTKSESDMIDKISRVVLDDPAVLDDLAD